MNVQIILDLTEEEASLLAESMCFYWDRGSGGEGWQSDELSELSSKVEQAVGQAIEKAMVKMD